MQATIKAFWSDYEERVVPRGAGSVQREECKRAFYAGAVAFYSILMDATSGENEEPSDEELATMQRLHDELEGFFRTVGTN